MSDADDIFLRRGNQFNSIHSLNYLLGMLGLKYEYLFSSVVHNFVLRMEARSESNTHQ